MNELVTVESWLAAWRSPLRFAVTFFGVLTVLLFLWETRSILVVVFLGVLFAVAIMPIVDRLNALHIPRGVGAAVSVVMVFAILSGIVALLAPVMQAQASELQQRIPRAIDRIDDELARRHIHAPVAANAPAQQGAGGNESLRSILTRQIGGVIPYLFPFFSTSVSALTGFLLLVFLTIFFAADPLVYKRGLLHLVPRPDRGRVTAVLEAIAQSLRRWLVARSIAMVTVGVVVTAVLALIGIPAFAALGVIAALLEFVPILGPIIAGIIAIALAFAESPQKALWVTIAFLIIQQLEGNVLIPMLLQKAVEIPAALSLIGISCFAIVLGIAGVLIAEPLVAAVLVLVRMLYVEPVIGDKITTNT